MANCPMCGEVWNEERCVTCGWKEPERLTPVLQLPTEPYLRRPADPLDAAQRVALIERASTQLVALDDYDADIAHWNRTHPHDSPIDPDPDGAVAEIRAYLTTLLRGAAD
jgi:hypothetical protein